MTPPGKRVQTLNPPRSEVGPSTVATWGTAVTDEVNVPEYHYEWKRKRQVQQAYCIRLDGSIETLNDCTLIVLITNCNSRLLN